MCQAGCWWGRRAWHRSGENVWFPRYQMNISQSMMWNVFWSDYFLSFTSTNIVSLMDTHDGQKNDHTGPSSVYQRREQTSYPRRYRSALATGHEWADTDSVDDETDVNSADLQGFVRSELEALSAGIGDFPSDLSSVFTQEESSKLENAAMDLSSVPEALVTIRAARDKMKGKSEGKGEPAVSFSGKGKGKWRKPNSAKHLQDKLAARKSKSTCHECGQRGHWAGDPQCPGIRDTNFTIWPDDPSFPDREDNRTIMVVERIGQFGVYPHSVQICVSIQSARILSRIFDVLLSMCASQYLLLSLARFIQHAQLILKNFVVLWWKIRNPVHQDQISDWESLTQLVSSASPAQTGGQITRVCWKTLVWSTRLMKLVKLRDTNLVTVVHSSLRSE